MTRPERSKVQTLIQLRCCWMASNRQICLCFCVTVWNEKCWGEMENSLLFLRNRPWVTPVVGSALHLYLLSPVRMFGLLRFFSFPFPPALFSLIRSVWLSSECLSQLWVGRAESWPECRQKWVGSGGFGADSLTKTKTESWQANKEAENEQTADLTRRESKRTNTKTVVHSKRVRGRHNQHLPFHWSTFSSKRQC